MKRIITLLSMFLFAGSILMAQTTQPKLSYGLVIRDDAHNLLVNKAATAHVSIFHIDDIEEEEALYTENMGEVMTDPNGLLILNIGDDSEAWSNIDWSAAKIRVDVICDGHNILHVKPVYAVPYALQAPGSMKLTTEEIVRYIMSINFNDDLKDQILKAYHENPNNLENDWVDTFKHYLMTHQDSIKSIILSYADKVTEEDIWNTYNTVINNYDAIKQGTDVLVRYAEDNMESALEIMKYYLYEFTPENQDDLQEVVVKLKANTPVYNTIKEYLQGMVREYLEDNEYVKKTDCPEVNICTGD